MVDKLKLMSSSLLPVILIESKSKIIAILVLIFVYRHTDKMISKLESAGLGFFVKATETQQKLGIHINGTSIPYTEKFLRKWKF